MDNVFSKKDLVRLTSEPLENQYQRMFAKIFQAISWTQGDILICFSGGKDSSLLLDMYCEAIVTMGLAHIPIQVAWANTTNETTAMLSFVRWFIPYLKNKYGVKIELNEVKPANGDNIITVMKREGLPFVSKLVASIIRKVTADLERNGISYDEIANLHQPTIQCRDALREMGLSDTTVLSLTGWSCRRGDFGKEFVLPLQWMPLLNIKNVTGKDIRFTEKCCQILKKDPMSRLNYPNMMTGEQALESKSRESKWLQTGCNARFADGTVRSKPFGAVSPEAVLYAIDYRNVPICSDYGKVVFNANKNCWNCTKAQRTGCALCGFGIKFDTSRFIRLQETEPAKVRFAFKPIEDGGLGYGEVCSFLNEYCGTKIEIPDI